MATLLELVYLGVGKLGFQGGNDRPRSAPVGGARHP